MTRTSEWVKKYQSYATRPRYLSLSWEREGILTSPNLTEKTKKDMNFRNAMFLHYLRPEKHQKSYPERTNFGNTMFLCYLRPEKCQKSYPERHEFWQHQNSLLP